MCCRLISTAFRLDVHESASLFSDRQVLEAPIVTQLIACEISPPDLIFNHPQFDMLHTFKSQFFNSKRDIVFLTNSVAIVAINNDQFLTTFTPSNQRIATTL